MIIRFPTAAATNDKETNDKETVWTQGRADGQAKKWSTPLANDPGPAGLTYLNGWIAGTEVGPP